MGSFLAALGSARLKRCARAIARAERTPDVRRVHGLRVSLKRLRTLLRLLRTLAPSTRRPAGAWRRLRAVFMAAGQVRDMQLLLAWTHEAGVFKGRVARAHEAHLEHQLKRAMRALSRSVAALEAKDLDRIGRYIVKAAGAAGRARAARGVERYIRTELQNAAALLEGEQAPDTLHEVRKYVKHAYHVSRLLEEAEVATPAQRIRCERINDLQDRLGTWQDIFVRWEHVGAWREGGRPAREQAALLEARIERQRARLTRLAREVLREFGH